MKAVRFPVICVLLCCCGAVYADPQTEAKTLRDVALRILKQNVDKDGDPKDIAECIFKLETAANILEKANLSNIDMATEINSELYWAKKISTLAVDAELDKLRGHAQPAPSASANATPKTESAALKPDADEPAELAKARIEAAHQDAASKRLQEAQTFAAQHTDDDYVVALNYFRVANENTGTDASLKALGLAQEAQQRFYSRMNANRTAQGGAPAPTGGAAPGSAFPPAPTAEGAPAAAPLAAAAVPDSPDSKLIAEADALAASGKVEESFAVYQAALKLKPSAGGQRKLGHAYFKRAQQIKDELLPKFAPARDAIVAAYKNAWVEVRTMYGMRRKFNAHDPAYLDAWRKYNDLVKEANVAFDNYAKAKSAFQAVLKLSPKEKDLDAAGHIGLCMSQKPDAYSRMAAKKWMSDFLKDYKPTNFLDRSIYEYCKTEYERICKG